MDLSKAFECLPHNIRFKLSAYGLPNNSVALLKSHLSNRQQLKVNSVLSSWADIHKVVRQGSILWPLLFKVFINELFSNYQRQFFP